MGLEKVRNVLLVMSGKGGVGKSTTAAQIALDLLGRGHQVAILDADLCGPSLPRIFHCLDGQIVSSEQGWKPVLLDLGSTAANEEGEREDDKRRNGREPMGIVSMSFLMPLESRDSAIVWRGPKKTAMIGQLLRQVDWGCLDYLVVDTPPGTSDEHVALGSELLQHSRQHPAFQYGAVIVTTPQLMALVPVDLQLQFCLRSALIPIVGIVENMAGLTCSQCHATSFIFSKEGACQLAEKHNVPMLGSLPFIPKLAQLMDKGVQSLRAYHDLDIPVLSSVIDRIERAFHLPEASGLSNQDRVTNQHLEKKSND